MSNDHPLAPAQTEILQQPQSAPAYAQWGLALAKAGRSRAAARAYQRAIALDPDLVGAWINLGALELAADLPPAGLRQHSDAAQACFREAAQRADRQGNPPQAAIAWRNLGRSAAEAGQFAKAEVALRTAIARQPHDPISAIDLGNLLARQNRSPEAIDHYRWAIAQSPHDPNLHTNYGLELLRAGQWRAGFTEYEWRLRASEPNRPLPAVAQALQSNIAPEQRRAQLAGQRILLTPELGFGDTIQFCRYAPALAAIARHVTLQVQAPLVSLVQTLVAPNSHPRLRVVNVADPLTESIDRSIALPSLPYWFDTRLPESPPPSTPYLRVPPQARIQLPEQRSLRVGIAWASGRRDRPDLAALYRRKSAPLSEVVAHLARPGLTLYSLQVGADAADLAALPAGSVVDLGPQLTDFAATAAAIAGLELTICVDTAIAHLAGALGRPVWVLLPAWADWRWCNAGELAPDTTPWYPTARLFRQRREGDWSEVLAQVAAALGSLLG